MRSDLIDPAIAAHHGRVVKRTGDGILIEFRSGLDAMRCAIEVQNGMVERNAGVPPERRIKFRVGIHVGDVVEESDGDLMGDGVNIAARLEGIAKSGAICLSEDAYRQVKGRLDLPVTGLGPTQLKNIAEPIRVFSLAIGAPAHAKPAPIPTPQHMGRAQGLYQRAFGLAKVFLGRSEETEAHVGEAMRLSRRDYLAHVWVGIAGVAKLHLGFHEEAALRFRRAVEMNKGFPIVHFYLAAALANLGRRGEAETAVKAGRALDPSFTVSRWRETALTFLAQHERILASMRLAGAPER